MDPINQKNYDKSPLVIDQELRQKLNNNFIAGF